MGDIPGSGDILTGDGTIENVVSLLGGGTAGARVEAAKSYMPRSDKLLGPDGKIYSMVELLRGAAGIEGSLLETTAVRRGKMIDVIGIPPYVDTPNATAYSDYGLTDAGWYAFLTIPAEPGVAVGADFSVTGAGGYVTPEVGDASVRVAVPMTVASQTATVTVQWDATHSSSYYVRATDLAIRNLDMRATFYLYDMEDYATYTWALTADATFTTTGRYYTRTGAGTDGDPYVYTLAEAGTDYQTGGYSLTQDATFVTGKRTTRARARKARTPTRLARLAPATRWARRFRRIRGILPGSMCRRIRTTCTRRCG